VCVVTHKMISYVTLCSFYPCIYMVYVWCDLAMFYLDFYCLTNTVHQVELKKHEHGVTMSFA
jgi:hypothetical protein